jgi:hypothetical protein
MKNSILCSIIPILAIATSAHAAADAFDDVSSNNIVNLTYYPHAGAFLFEPGFSSSVNTLQGGQRQSFNTFTVYGEYGLPWLNGFRLSVSESDPLSVHVDGGKTYANSGLADPTFSMKYRFLDDSPQGLSTEVGFSYSPAWASSDVSYISAPGASGAALADVVLYAEGFWRLAFNEAALSAGVTRAFSGSRAYPNNSSGIETLNTQWSSSITVNDRVHLIPKLYLEGRLNFNFAHSKDNGDGAGNSSETQIPFNVSPYAGIGLVVNKQVLVRAYFEYTSYTNQYSDSNMDQIPGSTYVSTVWGLQTLIEF